MGGGRWCTGVASFLPRRGVRSGRSSRISRRRNMSDSIRFCRGQRSTASVLRLARPWSLHRPSLGMWSSVDKRGGVGSTTLTSRRRTCRRRRRRSCSSSSSRRGGRNEGWWRSGGRHHKLRRLHRELLRVSPVTAEATTTTTTVVGVAAAAAVVAGQARGEKVLPQPRPRATTPSHRGRRGRKRLWSHRRR